MSQLAHIPKSSLRCLFIGAAILFLSTGNRAQLNAAEAKAEPRRYHSVTGLHKEKAEYYIKLHAETWPGVLKKIKEAHIQNYSIALKEIKGELYLFSYFEYTGSDFEADMRRIAEDPETQRWWRETDPCQDPLPDAKKQGKIWADAREVFYTR